jgi:hypothetical protein
VPPPALFCTALVSTLTCDRLQVPRKMRDLTQQLPSPRYADSEMSSRASNASSAIPPFKPTRQQQAAKHNPLPNIGESKRESKRESNSDAAHRQARELSERERVRDPPQSHSTDQMPEHRNAVASPYGSAVSARACALAKQAKHVPVQL